MITDEITTLARRLGKEAYERDPDLDVDEGWDGAWVRLRATLPEGELFTHWEHDHLSSIYLWGFNDAKEQQS